MFESAYDLISAAGKLNKSRIGTVKGNADEIFESLTKDGTRTPGGAYKLNDGTIINLHKSTTTNLPTISINRPNQKIIKIRIE